MSKQTVIVSGGMVEKDFALSILKSEETEFVIGVDRGLVIIKAGRSWRNCCKN